MPTKNQVKKIEDDARKLMRLENKLWTKYKWQHGGAVDHVVHLREVAKVVKPKSVSPIIGLILEDANFHTLNGSLLQIGAFTSDPWTKENDKKFNAYRKSGGKTWDL